jgi:ATP-binding cassette subfamily B protein/subfamily B ATP-binding cassette protein MsbA
VVWLALMPVAAFLASQAVAALRTELEIRIGQRMVFALGEDLFDHIQRLSPRFHARSRAGDLLRRVTVDCTCIRDLCFGVAMPLLAVVFELGLMLSVTWRLDPLLTAAGMLAVPLVAVAIRLNTSRVAERSGTQQELDAQVMSLAEQTLGALPAVKAFGREGLEENRFRALSAQAVRAHLRRVAAQLRFQVSVNAATAATTAVIMGVGGIRVLDGALTTGGLLVFLTYLMSVYAPMETLAFLFDGYATAAARAGRVREIFETIPEIRDPLSRGCPPLRALRARAPADRAGVLRLPSGSAGASRHKLRGLAGSDDRPRRPLRSRQEHLAALVARFFDPCEGRIMLDGIDLRELRVADLRRQVSVVLQEPFLLPSTVAENIAYGRPGADREEIVAAAGAAEADAFIRRLPEGYDTVLGERGANLSGGERQRLAIARAILKEAPVVVLDEPTSALDAQTEASVMGALRRLTRGRTAILIAHRLSTVRGADLILVMDRGMIVESGRHESLLDARGHYHRLHHLFAGGAADLATAGQGAGRR